MLSDLTDRITGFDESSSKVTKWDPEQVTPPITAMAGHEDNVLLALANTGLRRHRGLLIATGTDIRFYEQTQVNEAIAAGGRALRNPKLALAYTEILTIGPSASVGEELPLWTAHHHQIRLLCESPRSATRLERVLIERTNGLRHFLADRKVRRRGRRFALLHGPGDTVLNQRAWTRMWLDRDDVALADPRTRAGTTIPCAQITELAIEAPPNGTGTTVISDEAVTTLRRLRRRNSTRAVLHLDTELGGLDLASCELSPHELDQELTVIRAKMDEAGADDGN